MPVATKYQLSKDLYTQTTSLTRPSENAAYTTEIKVNSAFTGDFNNYCNNVGGMDYGFVLSADVTSFRESLPGGAAYLTGYYGTSNSDRASVGSGGIYTTGTLSTPEVVVKSGVSVQLTYGKYLCTATFANPRITVRRVDTAKPTVKSAAPLATTAYKKGDEAYISVIYSEPINSISGTPTLSLASSTLGQYFESPTYVSNGTGTNTLVFKVKAKKDITADEIQNKVNLYLAFPVSNVGGNFSSNIGTVTATVKDIIGNY